MASGDTVRAPWRRLRGSRHDGTYSSGIGFNSALFLAVTAAAEDDRAQPQQQAHQLTRRMALKAPENRSHSRRCSSSCRRPAAVVE